MTYTCQFCGASFKANEIRDAIKNKEPIIVCKSCGSVNEFQALNSSHSAKGFEYLSSGDFYRASYAFSTAIDDAKHHNHQPTPDTYLGYAMAQFRVQTVFSDDDTGRLELPTLICHKCNEMYFADSEAYLNAMRSVEVGMDISMQAEEKAKIKYYADYIDSIKDYYDKIKSEHGDGFKYNVFIAYEDMPDDPNNRGYEVANKVRNNLPDKINKVFVPDRDEYGSDEEYEAAILFAMENTNCMLVITDNDIDSRLINIYSRYYYIAREQRKAGSSLGFVRYCGNITIALPDRTIEKQNVFDVENKAQYGQFVMSKNGIVIIENKPDEPKPELPKGGDESIDVDFGDENGAPTIVEGNLIAFGSYPQRLCRNMTVHEHFSALPMPSPSDDCGWKALSYTKKGRPHMWYRDETYENKKYRLVYFTRYRDLYTLQESDVENITQQMHGYVKRTLYCFEFEPLIWNIKSINNDVAVLVSSHGIDSREYNNQELSSDWRGSTIHQWLNDEFLSTAFTEDELEYLGMLDSEDDNDKVYLVDKSFDRDYYHNSTLCITGSDYYKCIGGMGDSNINNYWITANINTEDQEAMVVYPLSKNELSTQYVDCSGVAVLPKIVIKFNK